VPFHGNKEARILYFPCRDVRGRKVP